MIRVPVIQERSLNIVVDAYNELYKIDNSTMTVIE